MSQEESKPPSSAEQAGPAESASDAAAAETAASDSTEALAAELAQVRQEAQQNWERYLREAAELQNLRKRAVEREEKARKFAVDRFAGDMLNVKDSLEMGLAAMDAEATVDTLREGVEATLRQLEQAFGTAGLKEVNPREGEPFDPAQHEAMAMQEVPDLTEEQVVTVVQKGYLLHERVLRPARVIVGRPAPPVSGGEAATKKE
jgi:molecular chaperone GrpE